MNPYLYANEPRPEELIAEIYRQIYELRSRGKEPNRVCLPVGYIRRLRIYHALLGSANLGQAEYIDHDSIFGLEFFVHEINDIIVY